MATLAQNTHLVNVSDSEFIGVAAQDHIGVYTKVDDGFEIRPGLCNAYIALNDAIALLQAAGYAVMRPQEPVEVEESEDEYYDRLADEAFMARWDGVSAHFGHD